jgi:amino acid transporter
MIGNQGTPWVSLVFQGLMSLILVFPGSFSTLVDYFGFTSWSIYGLAGVALILLRIKEPLMLRPFKVRPFPYLPGLFIFISFAVCIAVFAEEPLPSAASLGFVLLSIPFYFLFLSEHTWFVNLRAKARRRWVRLFANTLRRKPSVSQPHPPLETAIDY